MLAEHLEAQGQVLEPMSDEGATEEHILAETDSNFEVEAKAEECMARLRSVVANTMERGCKALTLDLQE